MTDLKLDVLAFGAHPDDVELGCGGTIHKMSRQGLSVGIVDLTEGEMGTRGSVPERYKEAADAAGILGVKVRRNLKISDANIQHNEENRARIIAVLREYRPQLVFAPLPEDRHPDHIHAGNLVKDACFYAGLRKLHPELGDPHRPDQVAHYMMNHDEIPTFIVDISEHFDTKMAAVRAYRSQFYNPDYEGEQTFISSSNFMEMLEARSRIHGWRTGIQYAEPFWVKETIVLDQPFDVLAKRT